MAHSPSLPELNCNDGLLELNKDLERITENIENMSVQLTWMAYDMAALRTSPELGASMRKLEEAHRRCRAAMENTEKSTEQASSAACVDLENIMKELDSLFECMDGLALRSQLRQCDLIVCVGHPDKLAFLKVHEATKQQPPV